MTRRLHAALVAAVLLISAAACGGDDVPAVEDSPTAAPAMEGATEPRLGPGATEDS